MEIYKDKRVVMTQDAGGTNFVFYAFRAVKSMLGGIRKDSYAKDLLPCLGTIKEGFHEVIRSIDVQPVAISFAFPGPADYSKGIIDNSKTLVIPGTNRTVSYDPVPRLAVVTSTRGASDSISLGACICVTKSPLVILGHNHKKY